MFRATTSLSRLVFTFGLQCSGLGTWGFRVLASRCYRAHLFVAEVANRDHFGITESLEKIDIQAFEGL